MPEQQILVGSGSPEILKLPLHSYSEYVGALVDNLHLTKDPKDLYEKSAMNLEPWLSSISLAPEAQKVTAELAIGPDTMYKKGSRAVELHSDDPLPQNLQDLDKHSAKRLGWYALAEAKLRYLDKHHEDVPALRGFNLQTRLYDIRSQAEYFMKHGSWNKDQTPIATKIKRKVVRGGATVAFEFVAIACGLKGTAVKSIDTTVINPPQGITEVGPTLQAPKNFTLELPANGHLRKGDDYVPTEVTLGEEPLVGNGPFSFDQVIHIKWSLNAETGEVKVTQLSKPGEKGYVYEMHPTEAGYEGDVAGYYWTIVHHPGDTKYIEDYKDYWVIEPGK